MAFKGVVEVLFVSGIERRIAIEQILLQYETNQVSLVENNHSIQKYFGLYTPIHLVKIINGIEIPTAEVELSLLLPPFSPLRCPLQSFLTENERFRISFPLIPVSPYKSYRALIHLSCSHWLLQLFSVKRSNEEEEIRINHCPIMTDHLKLQQQQLQFFQACSQFFTERIQFLSKMYSKKYVESTIYYEISNENSLPPTITNSSDEESLVYMHYYEGNSHSIHDWFERVPFEVRYEYDYCGEPIFCQSGEDFFRRLFQWQHPPLVSRSKHLPPPEPTDEDYTPFSLDRSCETVKYLIYEPPSNLHGIGSLLEVTAAAIRYAICLDRILLLLPLNQSDTLLKWRPAGCQHNPFECYFESLSHCPIDFMDYQNPLLTMHVYAGGDLDLTHDPMRRYKYIIYHGLPIDGPCSLCYDHWPVTSTFFDGLELSQAEFRSNYFDEKLFHWIPFTEKMKLPWIAQCLRYLLRPKPWFRQALQEIVFHTMVSPVGRQLKNSNSSDNNNNDNTTTTSANTFLPPTIFPPVYLSLHIRFGMKRIEVTLEPILRYMKFLQKKFPYVKDIFLSTETESIIPTLIREYPEYHFHFLRYDRIEYLNVTATLTDLISNPAFISQGNYFIPEFMYSFANLYVASEADAFIGTLTSNWCAMIHQLERTRGDGGSDYYSMDAGSAFTGCF